MLHKYIRQIILAITICLILNIWKCEKSKILVLLILGFVAGRYLLEDALVYIFGLPSPREDHDTNNDDKDSDGTSSLQEKMRLMES